MINECNCIIGSIENDDTDNENIVELVYLNSDSDIELIEDWSFTRNNFCSKCGAPVE